MNSKKIYVIPITEICQGVLGTPVMDDFPLAGSGTHGMAGAPPRVPGERLGGW